MSPHLYQRCKISCTKFCRRCCINSRTLTLFSPSRTPIRCWGIKSPKFLLRGIQKNRILTPVHCKVGRHKCHLLCQLFIICFRFLAFLANFFRSFCILLVLIMFFYCLFLLCIYPTSFIPHH